MIGHFSRWKVIVFCTLVVLGLLAGPLQQRLAQWWYEQSKPTELPAVVPTRVVQDEIVADVPTPNDPSPAEPEVLSTTNDTDTSVDTRSIPQAVNLDVPFTSQAPHGNWDAAHEEYCEEASILMAARFFAGEPITGPDDADAAMLSLQQWQTEHLGFFESTTAEETKRFAEANFDLSITIDTDVTVQSIQQALADGKLVILPAAGRELGNPYFQRPGPVYHMLVVKGYTADSQFITNDPGTRRGADFIYPEQRLLDAVGDYNHGDPANGRTVMLLVTRS